jgi:hypothetical protein
MQSTFISTLSAAIEARKNCELGNNKEWFEKWRERIGKLEDMLPHGSGIDSGTKIDLDKSHADKLVLYTSFHHMNEAGYYDGWTEHTITVTPGFRSLNLRISGRDRNQIKDYLYETYEYALTRPVVWNEEKNGYVAA